MKDIKAYIRLKDSDEHGEAIIMGKHSSSYAIEISLTDYMIEFAEWLKEREYEICNREQISFSTSELLDIYLTEKGIITE